MILKDNGDRWSTVKNLRTRCVGVMPNSYFALTDELELEEEEVIVTKVQQRGKIYIAVLNMQARSNTKLMVPKSLDIPPEKPYPLRDAARDGKIDDVIRLIEKEGIPVDERDNVQYCICNSNPLVV